jgi:ABC-2 type transport system ATP-binding protein
MTNDKAILVRGARKVWPAQLGRPARETVHDVSFQVGTGEIHGLLGPNGAGKTTTLKMLLGLVKASGGTFEVLGKDARVPASRGPLGFLPEQPYFNPQLTADQAMALYARLAGIPPADMKSGSGRLLAEVGLEGQGPVVLSRYSRGMLQRLGIAAAMLGAPTVLVLDEPASGLDPVGQRDVRELMLRRRAEGATVLLSSHQLSEVEAVCDRVTILDRGNVAAEGRIEDLLRVKGRTSVRARGLTGGLPPVVAALTDDVAVSAGSWVFSIPEGKARDVVDALDDAGATLEALEPKRESLEDYFAALLDSAARGVAAVASPAEKPAPHSEAAPSTEGAAR